MPCHFVNLHQQHTPTTEIITWNKLPALKVEQHEILIVCPPCLPLVQNPAHQLTPTHPVIPNVFQGLSSLQQARTRERGLSVIYYAILGIYCSLTPHTKSLNLFASCFGLLLRLDHQPPPYDETLSFISLVIYMEANNRK